MEVKLNNLSYSYKNKVLIDNISIELKSSDGVIGLVGDNKTLFMELLDLRKQYDGDIIIDNLKVNNSSINNFRRKIALVSQDNVFFTDSVKDEINFIIEFNHYTNKEIDKKIDDAFKLVGLDKSYLKRKINTLSDSELFLFKLLCHLIYNPDMIMIDDGFSLLDHNSKKLVLNLLKRLNVQKQRIVIISSSDVNFIYENCNSTIMLCDGSVIKYDKTENIFKDVNLLKKYSIDIPNLVKFTLLAKEKNIKLSYHRDILDLIKDVYKHV